MLARGALREVLPTLWEITRAAFRSQPEPARAAFANLVKEIRLARAAATSAAEFASLHGRKGLKVHLGCGNELKDGWVNLDINLSGMVPAPPAGSLPDTRFILCDLRLGALPLDDECCELIYSSHFFEHLEYDDGVRLMRDCRRVLQPGGIFRAALPDFPGMFRAYLARDEKRFDTYDIRDFWPSLAPETITLLDHVNFGVYQFGEHKCLYDEEKICLVLRHLGFAEVEITGYREGIDPDNELRRRYSFYVEAVK